MYQDARRVLAEELGVDPGRALQDLERAVLEHDRSLEAPQMVPPVGSVRPASPEQQPARGRRPGGFQRLPFVGRASELAALQGQVEEALAGAGGSSSS